MGFDVKTVPTEPAPQTNCESPSDKDTTKSADPGSNVDSDNEEIKSGSDVERGHLFRKR